MTGTWHWFSARAALVVACVAAPIAANADTHRTPVGHAPEVSTADREKAEREWMYATIHRRFAATHAIPAFARKYGMKCSACHLAVPVLNQFGQAFKDNGYRMKNGTDDLRANEPAYWPLFGWLWKDYEVDIQRVGGQTVQQQGGISNGALVLGGLGSIGDKVSFRFVPIIYEDGNTIVDHGWIRYNQAFGSDWFNIKVGSAELDLPINGAGLGLTLQRAVPPARRRDHGARSRQPEPLLGESVQHGRSAARALRTLLPRDLRPGDTPPRVRERIPPRREGRRVRCVRHLAGRP